MILPSEIIANILQYNINLYNHVSYYLLNKNIYKILKSYNDQSKSLQELCEYNMILFNKNKKLNFKIETITWHILEIYSLMHYTKKMVEYYYYGMLKKEELIDLFNCFYDWKVNNVTIKEIDDVKKEGLHYLYKKIDKFLFYFVIYIKNRICKMNFDGMELPYNKFKLCSIHDEGHFSGKITLNNITWFRNVYGSNYYYNNFEIGYVSYYDDDDDDDDDDIITGTLCEYNINNNIFLNDHPECIEENSKININ